MENLNNLDKIKNGTLKNGKFWKTMKKWKLETWKKI